MTIQTAASLYCDNGTTIDTGTGIDVRFLNGTNPAAADVTQTATFTNSNSNVERTFDPATAGTTNTNNAGTTLFKLGYALRLTQDMTPTDSTNCQAFLVAQTLTVNVYSSANRSGGIYVSGTYGPTMRASIWRYNPSTHTGTLIAAGSSTATTWNVAAVGGDLGTLKVTPISITIPAGGQVFASGEVLFLQLGFNTGTVPAPTLGTATFTHTLSVADPTNPTRIVFATGVRTVCPINGTSAGVGTAAGVTGKVIPSVASAAGVGTASGAFQATGGMVASASGAGTAQGAGSAVAQTAGTATGVGTANGKLSAVVGTVGTSTTGGGTNITYVRPIFLF